MSDRPWAGRRLHFIGIGGAGMSGLALISHELGAEVSGSDSGHSPYMERLLARGIVPAVGHAAANVPHGAEVVYSSAIGSGNPERGVGAVELHRSQLLAAVAGLKRAIAVTGTHGKSTTTAMIAHVLGFCGAEPAYVIGAAMRDSGLNARWGSGEWIVVEADESDRSLLSLRPEIALLTNAELDHHATYASRLDLEQTLAQFAASAKVAVVWDRPALIKIAAGADEVVTYDARAPVGSPRGTSFDWRGMPVLLAVHGEHNAVNAAGALTVASLTGISPADAVAAIASFQGARRRLELAGLTTAGIPVYDDYAHHPTEVAAAIAAARELEPQRLVAVFQPHLFSRTRALAREFGQALARADLSAVLGIYPARERADDFPGVTGHRVAAAAADASAGRTAAWLPTLADARVWLQATLRPGDLCLMMGAGDIDSLSRALVGGGGQ
ncbi:MAG: UDP-N-acetylmuramate--L-alanine ligase [Actinomycetota bacterium]|nr:UDP-N-acetylmuramate--L-alanine ligase [Actinomycetota bacterium]